MKTKTYDILLKQQKITGKKATAKRTAKWNEEWGHTMPGNVRYPDLAATMFYIQKTFGKDYLEAEIMRLLESRWNDRPADPLFVINNLEEPGSFRDALLFRIIDRLAENEDEAKVVLPLLMDFYREVLL